MTDPFYKEIPKENRPRLPISARILTIWTNLKISGISEAAMSDQFYKEIPTENRPRLPISIRILTIWRNLKISRISEAVMSDQFYKEIPKEIDHVSQFLTEFLRSGQVSKYREFQKLR